MKNVSGEWWFLYAGLIALAVGLGLRVFVPLQNDAMRFIEGLCLGLAIALLFGGLVKVRRDANRDSSNDSGRA